MNLDFFSQIASLHTFIIRKLTENKNLSKNELAEVSIEINVFLFYYGIPIVENHGTPQLLEDYSRFMRNEFIFKYAKTSKHSQEDLKDFVNSRLAFHKKGAESIEDTYEYDKYLFVLDALWSHWALASLDNSEELISQNTSSKAPFDAAMITVDMRLFFNHIVPGYQESLLNLVLEEVKSLHKLK